MGAMLFAWLPAHAVGVGAAAPPFALPGPDGSVIALAQLRGRVVYVDFWASWCTPCRQSFPWMNALYQRYRGDGLTVVAINVDKRRADADRFLHEVPAMFPIVFDAQGVTPAAFDVKGMPSAYLIDRDGVVVAVDEGFNSDRKAAVEQRIRALVGRR
jgi:thiol-disulfide isomerase/thioredoxin